MPGNKIFTDLSHDFPHWMVFGDSLVVPSSYITQSHHFRRHFSMAMASQSKIIHTNNRFNVRYDAVCSRKAFRLRRQQMQSRIRDHDLPNLNWSPGIVTVLESNFFTGYFQFG